MEAVIQFIDMGGYAEYRLARLRTRGTGADRALGLLLAQPASSEGELAELDTRLPGRKSGQGRTAETARGQA